MGAYTHFFSPKTGGDTEGVESLLSCTLPTFCRAVDFQEGYKMSSRLTTSIISAKSIRSDCPVRRAEQPLGRCLTLYKRLNGGIPAEEESIPGHPVTPSNPHSENKPV